MTPEEKEQREEAARKAGRCCMCRYWNGDPSYVCVITGTRHEAECCCQSPPRASRTPRS